MSKEIARVNQVVITIEPSQSGEQEFAMRYVLDPNDTQGVLAIQRLLSEKLLREIAAAFQQAVDYLDGREA